MFFERLGCDETFPIDDNTERIVIGRGVNCDLRFSSPHISRQHCEILKLSNRGTLIIKNLKDTNVTYVENYELRSPSRCVELRDGFTIGLGVPLSEEIANTNYVFLRLHQRPESLPDHDDIEEPQAEARHVPEQNNMGTSSINTNVVRESMTVHKSVASASSPNINSVDKPSLRNRHRKATHRRSTSQDGLSLVSNLFSERQPLLDTEQDVQMLDTTAFHDSTVPNRPQGQNAHNEGAPQFAFGGQTMSSRINAPNPQRQGNIVSDFNQDVKISSAAPSQIIDRRASDSDTRLLSAESRSLDAAEGVKCQLGSPFSRRLSLNQPVFEKQDGTGRTSYENNVQSDSQPLKSRPKLSLSSKDDVVTKWFVHNSSDLCKSAESFLQSPNTISASGKSEEVKESKNSLVTKINKGSLEPELIDLEDSIFANLDLTQQDPIDKERGIKNTERENGTEASSFIKERKHIGKRKRNSDVTGLDNQLENKSVGKKILFKRSQSDSKIIQIEKNIEDESEQPKLVVNEPSLSFANKDMVCASGANAKPDQSEESDSDSEYILRPSKKKRSNVIYESDNENSKTIDSSHTPSTGGIKAAIDNLKDKCIIPLNRLPHSVIYGATGGIKAATDNLKEKCIIPLNRLPRRVIYGAKKGKSIIVEENDHLCLKSPHVKKNSTMSKRFLDVSREKDVPALLEDISTLDEEDELPDLTVEPSGSRSLNAHKKVKEKRKTELISSKCQQLFGSSNIEKNLKEGKSRSDKTSHGEKAQMSAPRKKDECEKQLLKDVDISQRTTKNRKRKNIKNHKTSKNNTESNPQEKTNRKYSGDSDSKKSNKPSSSDSRTNNSKSNTVDKGGKPAKPVLPNLSDSDDEIFPSKSKKWKVTQEQLVKVKQEKTDESDEGKQISDTLVCKQIDSVTIKQEPVDQDTTANKTDYLGESDDDDDDVIFMYSQVDETIWVSSDEEETPQENGSFGPIPPSPDLDNAPLFADDDSSSVEAVAKIIGQGMQDKTPEMEKEEDQWLSVLSQNFWDDDDFMKPNKKELEKLDADAEASTSTADTSKLGDTSVTSEANNTSNTSAWFPELSQSFYDDDEEGIDATDGSAIMEKTKGQPLEKSLNKVIDKWKSKDTRKSMLIEPKVPLPRTKSDTLRKRRRTVSDPEADSSNKCVPKEGYRAQDTRETRKEDALSLSVVQKSASNQLVASASKSRRGGKRTPSLRDNLSCKYNLDSYKALAKHIPKDIHHLPSTSSKVAERSSSVQMRKSHLILDLPRSDENISIQKRVSTKESSEQSRPKVAAKITHKTRGEKLTEVNLFPSPQLPVTKPKKSKFTIPKNSASSKEGKSSSVQSAPARTRDPPSVSPLSSPVVGSTTSSSYQHPDRPDDPPKSLSHINANKTGTDSNCLDLVPKDTNAYVEEDHNKENLVSEHSGKGILKISGTTKMSKKKVHFPSANKELNKILYISPRKNREKLGSLEARAREVLPKELVLEKHQIPANFADLFIYYVCRWNYDWLETYRDMQEKLDKNGKERAVQPPPVVTRTSYPTLILYESYSDYKEIFSCLMYLEVWESLYRDWLRFRHCNVWLPTLIDAVQPAFIDVRGAAPLKSWRVKLIMLITNDQSNSGQYPRLGSLLGLRIAEGKKRSHIFGYVEQFWKHKKRMVSKELEQACPQGDMCIIMDVRVTKEDVEKFQNGRIILVSNVTYLRPSTRMWEGLCKLPVSPLCGDILNPSKESFMCSHVGQYLIDAMPLNEPQTNAVVQVGNKCVYDQQIPKVSLIHGPPGTGKTRTVVALIAQIVKLSRECRLPNCRILLCAPSNASVDELTLRLMRLREIKIPLRVVRVGMRDSVCSEVRSVMLDTFVKKQIEKEITIPKNLSLRKEWERKKYMVDKAAEDLQKARKEKQSHEVIKHMEVRLNELVRSKVDFERSCGAKPTPQEYHNLQQKWQQEILLGAEVITTTLGGCLSGVMEDVFLQKQQPFTCCIVDEAGQCKEMETWLPLLLGVRKLVLVGDHRQLPATVLSQLAQDKNLKQSLFERYHHRFCIELEMEDLVHTLNVQYRMHPEIVHWPSQHFYFNKLTTAPDVVQSCSYEFKPYIVFDLKSSKEERGPNNEISNEVEACVVRQILESLEPHIISQKIGVITPYQRQKQLLEGKLAKFDRRLKITVNTIDGFQGQERDIIVLSFVRANSSSNIGFLSQRQRLNVAMTRARKSCYVVANVSSLSKNKDWLSLIDNARARGLIISVSEAELRDRDFFKNVLQK